MDRLVRLLIATLLRRKVTAVERLRRSHDQALGIGNTEQAEACRASIQLHKEGILCGLELMERDHLGQPTERVLGEDGG
jgi:hypothetical protein